MLLDLFRHRKLAIILVTVGELERDDVVAGVGNVKDYAVWRIGRHAGNGIARNRRNINSHLSEVFGENHGERVAVDGGLDGGAFGDTLNVGLFNENDANTIHFIRAISTMP